jgi:hypothetical protein
MTIEGDKVKREVLEAGSAPCIAGKFPGKTRTVAVTFARRMCLPLHISAEQLQ